MQRTFFLNLVSGVGRSCRVKCLPTGLSIEGTAIRHLDRRAVQDSLQTRRIGIGHARANHRTAPTQAFGVDVSFILGDACLR
jgi:hypothetical protein